MSGGRRRAGAVAVALALVLLLLPGSARAARKTGADACPDVRLTAGRSSLLDTALAAGRDVLGERVLGSRAGPSYAAVRRLLPPLWYARGRGGATLTRSGAYYLTFAYPVSLYGEKAFALHVADGGEIVTRRVGGPGLTVDVGDGRERYGSCLARLAQPRLAMGYLPILRTTYVDARGVRYAQESFAGRAPGVRSLVSFVRLAVDARRAPGATAVVHFVASRGSRARLATDGEGTPAADGIRYRVRGAAVIHVAWVHTPGRGTVVADAGAYADARRATVRFWDEQLARGAIFDVPEPRVLDAERSQLVQQRILTWRYSVGNPYEELSFAEALDASRVMAAYGHDDVAQAILRFALRRLPARFTNWRAGAVLVAAADEFRLSGDPTFVESQEIALTAVLRRLERALGRHDRGRGLLAREAFSSDVTRRVVALHGQSVAWQGLLAMSRAWSELGRPRLARRAIRTALRVEHGLRAAARSSSRRLADGSLFVPAALDEGSQPFDRLTASRDGSYWNLVMPYVLASGLFDPNGPTARGIWRYMQSHGSLLVGLVRANAARLYRRQAFPTSGIDQVYGLELSRFLADADVPERLVLSLYGTLAGAMTRGTFVSGEASTVEPLRGTGLGSMYLPPNGGTATAFLENLRVMLVHERRDSRGMPVGLDLAFATPRAWLRPGRTVRVERAPTSFGPVSFTIARSGRAVHVVVDAPPVRALRLRLRLPVGEHLERVELSGRSLAFDRASGTIRLPAGHGVLRLVVRLGADG